MASTSAQYRVISDNEESTDPHCSPPPRKVQKVSATHEDMTTYVPYNEKHCVEVMKLLNADRKIKKTYCDGTLKAENKEYPVHKCIVGLVSEFLKTMFNVEMCEKYEKVVKICNMTNVILENILDFIYTGFVKMTPDNVFDLLEGAEYMQVDGLKSNCKSYLVQSTSVENCLKFRAYGQRYNLDELCDASDRVIAENFADVVKHEDFNKLDLDAVSAVITTKKEKAYEDDVFSGIVQWVNHNMDQRQELFVKLFSLVDLSALSQTFLNKVVLSEPLVFNSMQCFRHLHNPSGPLQMVAKCSDTEDNADKFAVIGGDGSERTCVTYDSKGNHPLQLPELIGRRSRATVVKIQHRLYLAGGTHTLFGASRHQSAEMLNLEDPSEWVKISDMLEGREYAASAVSNGRMVVTGGSNENVFLRSCEIYNCELNQWIQMKPMLRARWNHGMVSLNGLLYCVGGYDGSNALSSAECYDEKIDEWKEIAPMPTARSGLALVALNGFIYAIGGIDKPSRLTTVERYSPKTNTWRKRENMNVARSGPGACVMNGKMYVIGGKSSVQRYLKSVEVYDEAEDSWEICFDMDASAFMAAVVAL